MNLQNLKIGTQLKIGMGVILTLVVMLAALVWQQTAQLSLQTKQLYDHPLTVRTALDGVSTNILLMHRDMKDLFLTENDQRRLALIQSIAAHEADAARQFDILFDRYLGPKSDIEELHKAFAQWKSIRDETIRMLRAGDSDEAMRRTRADGVGGGHVEKMWQQVETVSNFARNKANQFYRDAEEMKRALYHQLGLTIAAIILLTLLISWFLLQNIRQPLKELASAAAQFRAGDLGARSRYVSKNEFGILAAGFNSLAETVQSELQSKEAAARIAEGMLQQEEPHAFCRELLKGLMLHTGSQIGGVYLLNDQKSAFDHFESIGLAPAGRASFAATAPEGEFGAALATGQIQHLADIPANARFTFATAGGEFQPREILTIPVPGDEGVVAVISLAGVRSYSAPAVRLVDDVWNLVIARLNGVLAAERTRAFAERIERQNEELQAQQEELEAQTEELQKQTEEVREQNLQLELQQLAVEEVSRLKSQFLSNMSHELRTPLNSVMALSRVLMMQARTKLSDEEVSYLEIIERNGKNLLRLINDILDLAKIEAGRMDIHPKPFSFGQAVENLMESIIPLAREKKIEIRQEIAADLPLLVSDELRVVQILQNLLANAVKFTDAGSVSVSVHSDPDHLFVRIADTGIGIAASDLPHIFDEFRQVDGTSARRHEGTGLGLAIARKAARMLCGEIAVESILHKGTTFTLTLPLAWSGAAPSQEPGIDRLLSREPSEGKIILGGETRTPAQSFAAFTSPTPPRILLVEDNEAAIIQVKAVLESAGHAVDVARGGQEAIDFVSRTRPDGIILDLMMPDIDGFAVLEEIRGTPATAKIPVLILTAKDLTPHDLQRLSANHVQQLVQKGDVDRETLLMKTRAMIGRGRERGTSECPTILIVEDNPDNMVTIKAVLQNLYRIIEATNGEVGLDLATKTRPDLILLDMALPKMDGRTVLRHLRENRALAAIPVIAMTAQVMKGDREEILAAGCDDYIAKPIDPVDTLKKITAWLHQ